MKRKLIGLGKTAEVYEYNEGYVLKLFKKDFSKEIINKEYSINLEIQKINNGIPKVHDLIVEDNRLGLIYDKINGQSLMDIMSKEWLNAKKYAELLAELHYELQTVTELKLPSNKTRLKESVRKSNLFAKVMIDKLCCYIDTLEEQNKLCHGDFHPGNIIISKTGNYVIDWVTATIGSPHSDIARSIVLLKYGDIPDDVNFLVKYLIRVSRMKFVKMYLKKYQKISKVKLIDIEKWELPHMVARLEESISNQEKKIIISEIKKKMKYL